MALIWVTGNSGTGKSTMCELLRGRGFVSLDADDGYSHWSRRTTGEVEHDPPDPVPAGWLDEFGWVISRAKVQDLAVESRDSVTFLCGSAENEAEVRDLFDATVCLVVDDETLRRRLATRTTNAFGTHPEELAAALGCNPRMRRTYERLGATIIDAAPAAAEVADAILAATRSVVSAPQQEERSRSRSTPGAARPPRRPD